MITLEYIREYCQRFSEIKREYFTNSPYKTNYFAKNGKIESEISQGNSGLVLSGTYTREQIIKLFIDYFKV